MKKRKIKKSAKLSKPKKIFLIIVLAIIFLIGITLIIYPFWPSIKYSLFPPEADNFIVKKTEKQITDNQPILPGGEDITTEEGQDEEIIIQRPDNQENLLIIPKIGVNIPIVEGTGESALNRGAWRLPETSTPDQGSNTVITGHRWLYRPPSDKTFYLLDKLEVGDSFTIYWNDVKYDYRVSSISIVEPTQVSVLNPTKDPIVTLITCTPLFSTSKRLIVRGELVE